MAFAARTKAADLSEWQSQFVGTGKADCAKALKDWWAHKVSHFLNESIA
jgi:hypothetical protein